MRSGLAAARAALRSPRAARQRPPAGGGMSAPLDRSQSPRRRRRRRSAARATHLLSLQHARGCWKGELETNVTMDAEDLLLREFLGIRDDATRPRAPRAGSARSSAPTARWATFFGGPPDLSTTIEAYVALRLAGDPADAAHMRRAARARPRRSAASSARASSRASGWRCSALWSWDDAAGAAARADPAAAAGSRSTSTTSAAGRGRRSCRSRSSRRIGRCARCRSRSTSCAAARRRRRRQSLRDLGRALPAARPRAAPLRAPSARAGCAASRCASPTEWILGARRRDGGWGGIQPPWVYSMIALHLLGYPLDHPVLAPRARTGSTASRSTPNGRRRLEACQSPVWDTALALIALRDAGVAAATIRALRARGRLARSARRSACRGDWAVRRPAARAGRLGRSSSRTTTTPTSTTPPRSCSRCAPRGAPGRRDVAGGDRARRRAGCSACSRADGGWAAFDVDNTSALCSRAPVLRLRRGDRPAERRRHRARGRDARAARGSARTTRARAGATWLLREQEPDGSWFGRWGANHVYGTGAAVPALIAAGVPATDPRGAPRRALARSAPERRRRLGRGPALLPRRRLARARRVDRLADGLGAARPARGGRARRRASSAASPGSWRRSAATATGTSRSSPAPASRATSTSTTTSTGSSSR